MDGWMDRKMDRWMNEWMDRRMLRGVWKDLMLMLSFSLPTPLHLIVGSIPGDSGDE